MFSRLLVATMVLALQRIGLGTSSARNFYIWA